MSRRKVRKVRVTIEKQILAPDEPFTNEIVYDEVMDVNDLDEIYDRFGFSIQHMLDDINDGARSVIAYERVGVDIFYVVTMEAENDE